MSYQLRIEQDTDPEAPDAFDDCGVWIVTTENRHFSVQPKGWDVDRAAAIARGEPAPGDEPFKALPLYAYVHSGVALSLGRGYPFDCPWDSGQIGFVVVDPRELSAPDDDTCGTQAALTVDAWNQYLSGDVWGYIVERVTTCDHGDEHAEHVDSCWGFYGRECAEQEGQRVLAYYERLQPHVDGAACRESERAE